MRNCRITPTEFDIERAKRFEIADELQRQWEAEQRRPRPIEPCRIPPELRTPAVLGSHYAGQALKHGCHDEYDNAMEARYGKGW